MISIHSSVKPNKGLVPLNANYPCGACETKHKYTNIILSIL